MHYRVISWCHQYVYSRQQCGNNTMILVINQNPTSWGISPSYHARGISEPFCGGPVLFPQVWPPVSPLGYFLCFNRIYVAFCANWVPPPSLSVCTAKVVLPWASSSWWEGSRLNLRRSRRGQSRRKESCTGRHCGGSGGHLTRGGWGWFVRGWGWFRRGGSRPWTYPWFGRKRQWWRAFPILVRAISRTSIVQSGWLPGGSNRRRLASSSASWFS